MSESTSVNSKLNPFKHHPARKNVIVGGAVILAAITVLSCVSSFAIYRDGFADFSPLFQRGLSLLAVIVVEGAFVWLVYGFTRAFASALERLISLVGLAFLVGVMMVNMLTHFMIVKSAPLHSFQHAWIAWGAPAVFIAILLIVLFITLADPVIRLIRLELRYLGLQQEKILDAKTEGLDSDRIQEAMAGRAEWEAKKLASRILGDAAQPAPRPVVGFTSAEPFGIRGGSVYLQRGDGPREKVGRPTNPEQYDPSLDGELPPAKK